jgi:hypothetical protein
LKDDAGGYAQEKLPCASAHEVKTDVDPSLSLGPPRSEISPTKMVEAPSHPSTHQKFESGFSSQEFHFVHRSLKRVA